MAGHDRIRSVQDYRRFLADDLRAYDVTRWRPWMRVSHPTLHYQRVLRRTELYAVPGPPWRPLQRAVWRVRLKRLGIRLGVSVPPGVFGPGLSLPHYGSIVVNDRVRAGAWCRVHSATNLGTANGGAPTLGDHVYLSPGAVLYGPIHVADRVVVAANAVLGRDVERPCTVGGIPAKVISEKDSRDVMPPWIVATMPAAEASGEPVDSASRD